MMCICMYVWFLFHHSFMKQSVVTQLPHFMLATMLKDILG